ncbi:MAG: hypothetical protein QME06_04675 [Desulfobacterales bacterium]|nr:hypothetical protein [Desulfobacterales bacterium]
MQLLREEVIKVISRMPESVDIDEVIYQLYVIDKIRKGRDASAKKDAISVDALKKEIEQW